METNRLKEMWRKLTRYAKIAAAFCGLTAAAGCVGMPAHVYRIDCGYPPKQGHRYPPKQGHRYPAPPRPAPKPPRPHAVNAKPAPQKAVLSASSSKIVAVAPQRMQQARFGRER